MALKHFLTTVAFVMVTLLGFSQTDMSGTTPLEIGVGNKVDLNGTANTGTALNIPSVINDKPDINLRDSLTRMPVKMLPDTEMLQAGHGMKIDPKVGRSEKQGGSNEKFGNQYLGDIKSNGKFIGIVCRDHEYVDGDRVKISNNDQVVDHNLMLTASFKGVNVDLEKGFNRLEFEALNEGSSSPNTAQVDVYDDQGQLIYSNKWLLSAGSKATLIITKE